MNASGSFESVKPSKQVRRGLECLRRMSQKHKMQYPQLKVHCSKTTGHLSVLQNVGKLLHRLADLLEKKSHHFAQLDTLDFWKRPIRETTIQTAYIAEFYRYYGGLADKLEGTHLPIDHPDTEVWATTRNRKGVVAAIVPWNSPLFLSAVKIGPAIAAGCTIVIKASEDAPAPMLEFAKLVNEAEFSHLE